MAWFQISEYQRVKMEWLVEATDAEAAREQFLDGASPSYIITQSVEDSEGVSVEAWDGTPPPRDMAGHVTDAARDLLASLRAILPYAESRAEDMDGCAEANEEVAKEYPEFEEAVRTAARSRADADKAVAAVDAAKALLASLDGDAPDAADASENRT